MGVAKQNNERKKKELIKKKESALKTTTFYKRLVPFWFKPRVLGITISKS